MYTWAEHTGEMELHVEAATLEEVFADALEAFAELTGDPPGSGEPAAHDVALDADDLPSLLAAWLEELVFLGETDGFVPRHASGLVVKDVRLAARIEGIRGRPSPLVKAVTYHDLKLAKEADVWRARVVLDV